MDLRTHATRVFGRAVKRRDHFPIVPRTVGHRRIVNRGPERRFRLKCKFTGMHPMIIFLSVRMIIINTVTTIIIIIIIIILRSR